MASKKLVNNPLMINHFTCKNKIIIMINIEKKAMYSGYLAFGYSFLSIYYQIKSKYTKDFDKKHLTLKII